MSSKIVPITSSRKIHRYGRSSDFTAACVDYVACIVKKRLPDKLDEAVIHFAMHGPYEPELMDKLVGVAPSMPSDTVQALLDYVNAYAKDKGRMEVSAIALVTELQGSAQMRKWGEQNYFANYEPAVIRYIDDYVRAQEGQRA